MLRRTLSILLLSGLPLLLPADEGCINTPTTSCLLQLIGEDIHAISDEDDGERWRRRYQELQHADIIREFEKSGLDAVMPRILRMEPSASRSAVINAISRSLAHDGDKRVLQLIWEGSDDASLLEAMLEAITSALVAGHQELAEKLFDDARSLFSRIVSAVPNATLFNKMKRVARSFDDEQLLEGLQYEYRSAVIASSNNHRELREAGAYHQGLQSAMQGPPGRERLQAVLSLSRDWRKYWGEENLQHEMLQEHTSLFKAASMYTLANHALRVEKNPDKALGYLDQAEGYSDGVDSREEQQRLYIEIADEYEEIARKYDVDIADRAMTLGSKIEDWEESLTMQLMVIMGPIERKDFAQAQLIAEREDRPLVWSIYHFFIAEQARDADDSAGVIYHVDEAARYLLQVEQAELRVDALKELGQMLRKIEHHEAARTLFLQAAKESESLPPKERINALEECASELLKVGANPDAERVLRLAHQLLNEVNEPKERVKALANLNELMVRDDLQNISGDYYFALEASLQGEALVDYYMMRAERSSMLGEHPAALNFITLALQQATGEAMLNRVLSKGVDLFKSSEQFPLLLSLLQHPAITPSQRDKEIHRIIDKRLKKSYDAQPLIPLIELLGEEEQVASFTRLLNYAHERNEDKLVGVLYARLKQMVKKRPALRMVLLDAMLSEQHQPLLQHYHKVLERHIAAQGRAEQQLYYRVMMLYRTGVAGEEAQTFISGLLAEVMAQEDRSWRGRTLLVCMMAIEGV